ncbi:MAG: hypothetical protein ACE15B_15865 [Bryobacteraceae bacterium]
MRYGCCAVLALLCACRPPDPGVALEVFAVGPGEGQDSVRYLRRVAEMRRSGAGPDALARELTRDLGAPAILHSTSWRWEKDARVVLTYLAYYDKAEFPGNPVELPWGRLAPPPATDPQRPRPARIREEDVLAHGLRHFSFLVRYARDGRLAAALSPRSLAFFRGICGQLAGRLEAAREFEECGAAAAR